MYVCYICVYNIYICLIPAATYSLIATTFCEKIEIVNVENVISYTDGGPMLS